MKYVLYLFAALTILSSTGCIIRDREGYHEGRGDHHDWDHDDHDHDHDHDDYHH